MNKPSSEEYNPYFQKYIDLVSSGDYFENFENDIAEIENYFENVPLEKQTYSYAEGKWSIKQVLMHIIDTERSFAFRLLVIIRKDIMTLLQPYDDNLYASNANVENREMSSLLEEFKAVRKNTEFLLKNLDEKGTKTTGQLGAYKISARAIGYILLGHSKHHLSVLKERYLTV